MKSLTLVRRIAARPSIVFEAMTTAEGVAAWFGPDDLPVVRAEVDPRVGGAYRVHFRTLDGRDGHDHEACGEFLELVPPRRIVMSWTWASGGVPEEHGRTSRLEIELTPVGDGTLLTFTHASLWNEASEKSHTWGWTGALNKLVRHLEEGAATTDRGPRECQGRSSDPARVIIDEGERNMRTKMAMSRRSLLAAGAGSLAVACGGAMPAPSSPAAPGATHTEETVRKWYAAWEAKDWGSVDALAADDFTFSSAAGDDHISKSTFKARCWDTQSALIDRVELESVLGNGNEVFVKYVCRTKSGKAFRNVEHFTFKGDKIAALECYFGDQAGYPSAANKGNG